MMFWRRTFGLIWIIWCLSNTITAAVIIRPTKQGPNTLTQGGSSSTDKILIQKCCQFNEIIEIFENDTYGCVKYSGKENINASETNGTWHLCLPNKSQLILKSGHGVPCEKFVSLNDDEFEILPNGSLYTPNDPKNKIENIYCVDHKLENGKIEAAAFICTPGFSVMSFVVLLISAIALSFSIGYLMRYRSSFITFTNYCLLGFVFCMAACFLFMAILEVTGSDLNELGTSITGNLLYFLTIKYYIWLNMAIYHVYKKQRQNLALLCIPFIIPLQFVLASWGKIALPMKYTNPLDFEVSTLRTMILYFEPIFFSLLLNTFMLFRIKRSLTPTLAELQLDLSRTDWTRFDCKLTKQLYRIFIYIVVIMWMLFIADLLEFFAYHFLKNAIRIPIYDTLASALGLVTALAFLKREHRLCSKSSAPESAVTYSAVCVNPAERV